MDTKGTDYPEMNSFVLPIQVRWSDIDPNRHVRHSVYYDYGAYARVACFAQLGLTTMKLEEMRIGPILLREEAMFRKEIKFEDKPSIDTAFSRANADFSRWSIRHQLFKEDGKLAAMLNMDGAWIDLNKRKLTSPNEFILGILAQIPRTSDFSWTDRKTS